MERMSKRKNCIQFLKYGWKTAAFLACVSALFAVPALTQSRYVAYINGTTAMGADSFYFSSNLLAETSQNNEIVVAGWQGTDYSIGFDIRNYENALLFKAYENEIIYNFGYEIKEYAASGDVKASTDYRIIHELNGVEQEGTATTGRLSVTEDAETGEKIYQCRDEYHVTLVAPSDAQKRVEPGGMLELSLWAEVPPSENQYHKKLALKVVLERPQQEQFIVATGSKNGPKYNYTLKTSELLKPDGSSVPQIEVTVFWKGSALEENEYSTEFYSYMHPTPESGKKFAYTAPKNNAGIGKLKLMLKPNMYINLEFILKQDGIQTGEDQDIWFKITDKNWGTSQ